MVLVAGVVIFTVAVLAVGVLATVVRRKRHIRVGDPDRAQSGMGLGESQGFSQMN